MIREVTHIGITVKNMNRSLKFYRDILGLIYKGELVMEGKETDLLFGRPNSKARVCYLNGSDKINTPPIELIEFEKQMIDEQEASLFRTCISEICFTVDDIEDTYLHLINNKVECLSEPQYFDFTKYGFSKSKALYFRDPDGNILELIERIK